MMRSRRLIVLFALMLSAVAAGAVSAAGLRATLEVDRAWLGSEDDVVAAVTITNDSASTILVPHWQVPGARLEADLFNVTLDGPVPRTFSRICSWVCVLSARGLEGSVTVLRSMTSTTATRSDAMAR